MKIYILINDITRHAGRERAVCNLANSLITNHEVTLLSRDTISGKSYFPLHEKVRIEHLGTDIFHSSAFGKIFVYFQMFKKLKQIANKNRGSVFIATISTVNAMITLLKRYVKTVGCEHFNYESACFRQRVLRRMIYPRLDAVVLLTQADSKHYTFIKRDRLFIIPNSISFTSNETAVCEEKRIIAVGRLEPQKGFDFLLDAAVILKKEIPDWHLDIFGDGEKKIELLQKISYLYLEDFVFINEPTPNIKEEFLKSSIYVMSSRYEGLPMVLLESQYLGLPAVSFDCPTGPSEIIMQDETGFLVPLYDTAELAKKIIELAENTEKRKQFGINARKYSDRFSAASIAEKWEDLLQRI